MRLQTQLFLLSLFTLALPWAGIEYIKKIDGLLRDSQVQTQRAVANAITQSFFASREIQAIFKAQTLTSAQESATIYATRTTQPLTLDGYADDWTTQNIGKHSLENIYIETDTAQQGAYRIAEHGNLTYFYFEITDKTLQYRNVNALKTLESDAFELVIFEANGEVRYRFAPAAPGKINVETKGTAALASPGYRNDFRINAYWRENENGYQLEFAIPSRWVSHSFAFSIKNAVANQIQLTQAQPSHAQQTHPLTLIRESDKLRDALKLHQQSGMRLILLNSNGFSLASNGKLTLKQASIGGIPTWLYKLIRQSDNATPYIDLLTNNAPYAGPTQQQSRWIRTGFGEVLQTRTPLFYSDNATPRTRMGEFIIEQSAQELQQLTNTVLSRLFIYSFWLIVVVSVTLFSYASWLSLRIRKLSLSAKSAISDSGVVNTDFKPLNGRDELSELSHNYRDLLLRLNEYTGYLRTLASKLSHELRTPLAIVSSSLDNLSLLPLSEDAHTYAERAKQGNMRLSGILNAMSAASKVEQAINTAEQETVDVKAMLLALTQAYRDTFTTVSFDLKIENNGSNTCIQGSSELLVQLLDKLVDNAVDFSPANGVISITLTQNTETLTVTVTNQGPHLPAHMQGQLFDSMVSMRPTHEQPTDKHHLGLGLYIVRLISDFHQGNIRGYNIEHPHGVAFELKLPIN